MTMGEAAFSCFPRDSVARADSFAHCLRQARQTLYMKQTCLSSAMSCTDAAISFWETGQRLPNRRNFQRLIEAMAAAGATSALQRDLCEAWLRDRTSASQVRAWRRMERANLLDGLTGHA